MTAPENASGTLMARTLGHACLAVYRDGRRPVLLTDPWLVGSVYWRSWWLQHYPSADEIDWLATTAHVYVTHEHSDHFHMPSIRRLGSGPAYLFPALAERGYLGYLTARGYRAEAVEPLRWRSLGEGVSILSIPVWNDDSLLLIDTPNALILNLNDAKPPPPVLRAIRHAAERIDKPRVLLCSYSPASLVNSFLDANGIVSLRPARHYVDYVCRLCDRLGVDFYMPFASQAVFHRADSCWANDYRTTFDHLCRYWQSNARLLPPYTTLDLSDFTHRSIAPDHYRAMAPAKLAVFTQGRAAAEEAADITSEEVAQFERKLNAFRWLLRLLFARGFAFRLGERCLEYDPSCGKLRDSGDTGGGPGDFVVDVPKLTIKEAVRNNHLSDLGITMFVRIRLLRPIDPRKVYGLFVLFQFDDYGHLDSIGSLLRWLRQGIRFSLPRRLPLPQSPPQQPAATL
jgi:Beta-lactamase superfamily domain